MILSKKPFMQRLWSGKNLHAAEDEINKPSDGLSLFLGCNSFADYEIGRVLDKIREVAPDALVIFIIRPWRYAWGIIDCFLKMLQRTKRLQISCVIKGGAKGYVEEAMASHIDIAPTILDYFDIPIPKLMEGKSMLSQIENPEKEINDVIFTEFTRYEIDHDGLVVTDYEGSDIQTV